MRQRNRYKRKQFWAIYRECPVCKTMTAEKVSKTIYRCKCGKETYVGWRANIKGESK